MGTEKDRQDALAGWDRGLRLNLGELSNLEKVKKATLRDNTIAAGTAQDKLNILTGRPTSITEVLRARYVEGNSLRSMASRVIDVPALPARAKVETKLGA
jgi:hypothetical protein